jgi:hypothetical protein
VSVHDSEHLNMFRAILSPSSGGLVYNVENDICFTFKSIVGGPVEAHRQST